VSEPSSPTKVTVSESVRSVQAQSQSIHWYQHVRQVDGTIVRSLDGPPSPSGEDEAPVASLGFIIDSYLESHGYTLSAKRHIEHAYHTSRTIQDFTHYLGKRGIARLEARWYWIMIVRGLPDSDKV